MWSACIGDAERARGKPSGSIESFAKTCVRRKSRALSMRVRFSTRREDKPRCVGALTPELRERERVSLIRLYIEVAAVHDRAAISALDMQEAEGVSKLVSEGDGTLVAIRDALIDENNAYFVIVEAVECGRRILKEHGQRLRVGRRCLRELRTRRPRPHRDRIIDTLTFVRSRIHAGLDDDHLTGIVRDVDAVITNLRGACSA